MLLFTWSGVFVEVRHDNVEASLLLHLYRAAVAGDLVALVTALAQGAPVNGSLAQEEGRTALIAAAQGVREHGLLLWCSHETFLEEEKKK